MRAPDRLAAEIAAPAGALQHLRRQPLPGLGAGVQQVLVVVVYWVAQVVASQVVPKDLRRVEHRPEAKPRRRRGEAAGQRRARSCGGGEGHPLSGRDAGRADGEGRSPRRQQPETRYRQHRSARRASRPALHAPDSHLTRPGKAPTGVALRSMSATAVGPPRPTVQTPPPRRRQRGTGPRPVPGCDAPRVSGFGHWFLGHW